MGYTGLLDEVFVKVSGRSQYLWRAVDQDGDVINTRVQPHRGACSAEILSEVVKEVSDGNRFVS